MLAIFIILTYIIQKFVLCDNLESLFLTSMIEAGKIKEARTLAQVKPFLKNEISFSGYLTVNREYESNLYFWFFTADVNWSTAPLIL